MSDLKASCDDVREAGPADAVDGVRPAWVARPASAAEVAEVMRAAAGLAVVVRGAGSKLTWGRPPRRVDLIVDLSRMAAVTDHAAGDLVVVAQAGTPLAAVRAAVGAARQRLAIDETVPGATVGGTIAAATSGPLRQYAGTARDLLIGVTLVLADGTIATAGGRVVKNVAGYDLGKLVAGSYGTLAVVTEAVFRLHPLPAARAVVSVPVADPGGAAEAVRAVATSQVVPAAVELDWPVGGAGTLAVLLEGMPAGVAGRSGATAGLLGADATAGQAPPPWWGTYPWSTGDTAIKLTFVRSGLPAVLAAARAATPPVALRGSAGVGVLYGAIPGSSDPAAVAGAVDALRSTCASYRGSLVVLDAPRAVKEAVDTWGPVPGLELMRRVKDRFDPEHRLAPGRFVGGI